MKKYIFNSSMPRSGSELLQVILHQNPSIYGSVTSPLCEYITAIKGCQQNSEVKSQPANLMKKAQLSVSKGIIDGYYNAITDRTTVVDKSRQWMWNYDLLEQVIGTKPKMICMIRDLRDVFTSMEKNWRKNRHLPQGPDNLTTLENMTVEERIATWSHENPVGFATQRLKSAGELNQLQDVFILRYEDLTMYPDECMQKLYEYIELPYYQHDFNNIVKEVEEDDKWHGIFGNHEVKKELKPYQSDYKEVLGEHIGQKIIEGHKWFFKKFYPEAL